MRERIQGPATHRPPSRETAGGLANPRFRVLVVTNLWPTKSDPGYGSFVQAQMESLRACGVDYDVLAIDGRDSAWNYARAVGTLHRRLRANRYHLIHAHFGLSGCVARCQWRVPVVVSFLGDDVLGRFSSDGRVTGVGHLFRVSSLILARTAAAVIVKNAAMKARLRLQSAYVIPNGVDLNLFQPGSQAEARSALGLDSNRKYVLFPYDPAIQNKRHDLIEAAVNLARASCPGLEILYVRGIKQSLMPRYMNAADALVLASHSEGSPNAVKEAMAVNLPVITVDVGDAARLVGSTGGCYIVRRDAQDIAEKIAAVCRRGTRTCGREWIKQWSSENTAKQIVAVYARVVDRAGS